MNPLSLSNYWSEKNTFLDLDAKKYALDPQTASTLKLPTTEPTAGLWIDSGTLKYRDGTSKPSILEGVAPTIDKQLTIHNNTLQYMDGGNVYDVFTWTGAAPISIVNGRIQFNFMSTITQRVYITGQTQAFLDLTAQQLSLPQEGWSLNDTYTGVLTVGSGIIDKVKSVDMATQSLSCDDVDANTVTSDLYKVNTRNVLDYTANKVSLDVDEAFISDLNCVITDTSASTADGALRRHQGNLQMLMSSVWSDVYTTKWAKLYYNAVGTFVVDGVNANATAVLATHTGNIALTNGAMALPAGSYKVDIIYEFSAPNVSIGLTVSLHSATQTTDSYISIPLTRDIRGIFFATYGIILTNSHASTFRVVTNLSHSSPVTGTGFQTTASIIKIA